MDARSIKKPRSLRALLVEHGLSYRQFAIRHGYNPRTVKAAVRGERAGKVSREITAKILDL